MVSYAFTLENFEYWLLILVRISAFMYLAPFFGNNTIPGKVKVGFSVFISLIVYTVAAKPELDYEGMVGYAVAVLSEGITGLLIGLAANICNSIVLYAGTMIDMDIGLSMATQFNPEMGTEMTLTGNLYYYLVMLLMTGRGMQGYLIRTVSDSFSVIPIGNASFNWDHLYASMVQYVADMFVLGFRIFLPFFACIMVLNCVLGIMAKVAPQLNMFAVGMQLKVMVGYAVLMLTFFMLPRVADLVLDEIKTMVVRFVEGMY